MGAQVPYYTQDNWRERFAAVIDERIRSVVRRLERVLKDVRKRRDIGAVARLERQVATLRNMAGVAAGFMPRQLAAAWKSKSIECERQRAHYGDWLEGLMGAEQKRGESEAYREMAAYVRERIRHSKVLRQLKIDQAEVRQC